jgi:hypothetical protein
MRAPRSETVLFNLLAGFLGSFALSASPPGASATVVARSRTSHRRAATSTTSSRNPARLRLRHEALLTDDDTLEQRLASRWAPAWG